MEDSIQPGQVTLSEAFEEVLGVTEEEVEEEPEELEETLRLARHDGVSKSVGMTVEHAGAVQHPA